MGNEIVLFNEHQLNKLFPFYFLLDSSCKIVAVGQSLEQLVHISTGDCFCDHFEFTTEQNQSVKFEHLLTLTNSNIVFRCIRNTGICLTGELTYLEQDQKIIFIGSPIINTESFTQNNLSTSPATTSPYPLTDNDFGIETAREESEKYLSPNINTNRISKVAEDNVNGIVITDKDGAIQWVNRAFENLSGYTLEEIKGLRPRKILYGPESVHIPIDYVDQMILLRKPFSFDNVGYRKNGETYWFRTIVHPIIDENNEVTGRFSTLEDITDIKTQEIELRESRKLWQTAFESAGHGIWTYDIPKQEIKITNQFKKLLGYSADEAFETEDWFNAMHPEDFKVFQTEIFTKVKKEDPNFTHQHRLKCKDGQYRYFITRAQVLEWNADEQPIRTMGTLTDINDFIQKDIELISTTERLSQLIKNLNEGVLLEDQNRKIILVNEQFINFFLIPATPEQLVGFDCSQSAQQSKLLFANPEAFVSRIDEILAARELIIDEKVEMADGKILQRDYIPIVSGNQYLGHLWKYKDVTEQINAEKNLREQKEYYHRILNEIPADIAIIGVDYKYQYLNKNAVRNDEIRQWMIGKTDYDYCKLKNIETEYIDKRRKAFQKAIKSLTPQKMVDARTLGNGVTQYILRLYYPHVPESNKVDYIINYGIDITEQVRNEQFAELQEQRIRNLLEIIKDGVIRCYEDGTINLYSNAFKKIMNLDTNEGSVAGKLNFFKLLPEDELQKVKKKIEQLYTTGESQFGVFQLTDYDGNEKIIDYTFTLAIRAEDAAFVGRLSDITAIVNKEKYLKEVIDKEKDLSLSKSQFIRITSHELRTPLAIIQANSEILEMVVGKKDSEPINLDPRKMIERINKEVAVMTDILNRLLMISRIESGNIEFVTEIVNVNDFLSELKSDLYDPYTDNRTLVFEPNPEIGELIFDKKLMRLAIVNLINNAFKYSAGKQPPELMIYLDGTSLIFRIRDYGIGIPAADNAKLFQTFNRASNVGVIQGTGIGLVVVDYAIKKHYGRVWFESDINKGTTFFISLPQIN